MIKGYIFDLDGVITETAKLHFEAWRDEVKKIGLNLTKNINTQLKGLPRLETLKTILGIYNVKHLSESQIQEMAFHKNQVYLEKLKSSLNKSNILPGVTKFLQEVKKNNLKTAIASSSHNASFILKKLNLLSYFDFIVDINKIQKGKPAPDIYLAACKGLNLLPSECVGFEDAIPGIKGLNLAKIKSVAITHKEKGDWNKADLVFESTTELDFQKVQTFFA